MTFQPAAWICNRLGMALSERSPAVSNACYRWATRWNESWDAPWFNLGLNAKLAGNWSVCLRANQQAVRLNPDNEGAWWNLGIAAAALSEWSEARRAWRASGIECPPGTEEVFLPLGAHPVRLHPRGSSEVVWCKALDPARARIANVPLPQSGFRFGDIVLRDGTPNGFRVWQGVEVPVFDVLALWKSSGMGTYEVEIGRSVSVDLLGQLEELAIQRGWGFERTAMIRQLDDRCDKGTVSATSPPAETGPGTAHQCLASAPDEESLRSLFGEFELESHCSLNARILCRLAPSTGSIEVTEVGS